MYKLGIITIQVSYTTYQAYLIFNRVDQFSWREDQDKDIVF